MESVELATAYVSLVPSLQGAQGKLAEQFGGEGDKAGKSFTDRFKGALAVTAVVGGVVAGFTGLYKAGSIFDDVADTIRVGTGATGEALQQLQDDARAVATTVPTSFEAAGQTVADLNTRLGLSGETLQTVASQYLEAGRILGQDVDINKTSAAFSAFKIEGDSVVGAMDSLFQVSQATGVGMNELAAAAQANAPALQNLGFGFEETVSLVGSLDKAGLNSTQTLAAMSKGLVTLAKDGEEPQAAFRRVTDEIQTLIASGDTAGAIDLASGIFGTRAANQFVGAVQSGTLALDDLVGATGATGDTILGVAAETADFAESWQIVKNNALAAIEPIASGVFNLAGGAMGKLAEISQKLAPVVSGIFSQVGPVIGPLIGQVAQLWAQFSPLSLIFQALQPVLPVLVGALTQIATAIGGALSGALSSVMSALAPVVQLLVGQLSKVLVTLAPIVAQLATVLGNVLGSVLTALAPLFELIAQLVSQVLMAVLPLIDPILQLVAAFIPLLTPIIELVGALLQPLIQLLTTLLTPILALIQPLVSGLAGALGVVIDIIAKVIKWVADAIGWFVRLVTGSRQAGDQFNAVWQAVGKWFADVWNGIVNGLSNAIGQIGQFIGTIWDTVMGALGNVGSWLVNAGRDLVRGFWEGIVAMGDWLWRQVTGFFDNVTGWAKDILGIQSPSRVFRDQVGKQIAAGVAEGIGDGAHLVNDAIDDLVHVPDVMAFAPTVIGPSGVYTADVAAYAAPGQAGDTYVLNGLTTRETAREIGSEIGKTRRRGYARTGAFRGDVG